MLSFSTPTVYQSSKCFVTYGRIGHIDPKQLPSKGKPWSSLAAQDFVCQVELVTPQESYSFVREKLIEGRAAQEFTRVRMSLGDVLQGPFFMEYIKKGNVLMLSEGRTGVDNVFSLKDGQLTMFLEKETYERAGLVGKPHGAKASRGLKPRWIVKYDLRSPSMFPGKKGFDRLVYAAKNVLNAPFTWLFCNLYTTTPDPDPLLPHCPTKYTSSPGISQDIAVAVPSLKPPPEILEPCGLVDFEYFATETYEWLSLVRLQSPRVEPDDGIDSYLSRYQLPGTWEDREPTKLCKVIWQGFLSPSWTKKTLIDLTLALPAKSWFAFSATTFSQGMMGDVQECIVMRPPDSHGEYIQWDTKGHE